MVDKKTKATLFIVALAIVALYFVAPDDFFQLNSAVNLSSETVNVSVTYANRTCASVAGAFCSTGAGQYALPELGTCPTLESQCFVCQQGFEYSTVTNSCVTYAQQLNAPKPAATPGYVNSPVTNPTTPYSSGQAAAGSPTAEDTPSYIWLVVVGALALAIFYSVRKGRAK